MSRWRVQEVPGCSWGTQGILGEPHDVFIGDSPWAAAGPVLQWHLTSSGPGEEELFDHCPPRTRYNLKLSPVTDHMLQRGRKLDVSAKTLARESKRQT